MKYLIWSNEHRAWWRPDEMGYTHVIEAAGRYNRQRAVEICAKANIALYFGELPNEVPVLEADALECMIGQEHP